MEHKEFLAEIDDVNKRNYLNIIYDREPTFVCYERAGLFPSQLESGSTVTITMGGNIPGQVTLQTMPVNSVANSLAPYLPLGDSK